MNSKTAIYTGFQFEVDGLPAIAIINADVKMLAAKFEYNYAVFIEVEPIEYNENGHPEGEEYEYLLKAEKEILQGLEAEGETIHIGHTTLPLKREIILYTNEPQKVEDFLNVYLPTIKRESSFEIMEDEDWENVEGFYEQL